MSSRPNVRVTNLKGEDGALYITDTNPHVGVFESIQALEAAVAALVSPNIVGALGAVPIPAGAIIYGRITSITLASGKVMAYTAPT